MQTRLKCSGRARRGSSRRRQPHTPTGAHPEQTLPGQASVPGVRQPQALQLQRHCYCQPAGDGVVRVACRGRRVGSEPTLASCNGSNSSGSGYNSNNSVQSDTCLHC